MTQAFVSSFTPVALVKTPTASTSPARRSLPVAAPRMQLKTEEKVSPTFSRIEENRRAKSESEYRGPQGFTPYAEKVNGRMAMLGFFIGLVTEAASGVPINEQMLIMFSPLTNTIAALAHLVQ